MAPNRKRGASKAAAAEAAKKKWKVGDLVLAKVKGFPAWPATVSEPEKWDQPVDLKKVFVHFFGTGQVGFCHPVDVEEFTEEKSASLLGKRHGKGADFVRAVKEITDSYENARKQEQISTIDSREKTSLTTVNKSKEPLSKPGEDAPVVTVKLTATEAVVALAAEDASHDNESQMEAVNSGLFMETPLAKTYSTRSKTEVAQSHNGTHRRISARKLRRSSSRHHNSALPSMSSRRSRPNSLRDRSLRRSKRFVKCSDDSEEHNSDSPSSSSNDSVEENDSGTMTVDDSDIRSHNDGSSVESGRKPLETESAHGDNDGEMELNDRLDFQNKTVIIKKKRKPNRKRLASDAIIASTSLVVSEAEAPKLERVSPGNTEKLVTKVSKENGDEHLPLVKRARIRMGGTSLAEERESSVQKEEKMSPVLVSICAQHSKDEKSVSVKGEQPILSLSHQSPRKPLLRESRKSFADDEAALPPSKRLQRALEAMSANVAENNCRASSCSPHSNDHSSSLLESSEHAMDNKSRTKLGSEPVVEYRNDDSYSQSSASDMGVLSDNISKASAVVSKAWCINSCSVDPSGSELRNDSLDHLEDTGSKRVKRSPLNEQPVEVIADQHVKPSSPNLRNELAHVDCKIEVPELNKDVKEAIPKILQLSTGAAEETHVIHEAKCLPFSETNKSWLRSESLEKVKPWSVDSNVEPWPTAKPLISSYRRSLFHSDPISDGACTIKKMSSPSSLTRFISQSESHSVLGNSSSCNSNVNLHLEKAKLAGKSSPSSLTRFVSQSESRSVLENNSSCNSNVNLHLEKAKLAGKSSPSSLTRFVSQSESHSVLENNSPCNSNVHLHLEKAKLAGKSSNKDEYLSSFESSIKSLTRTKESIGRATRIAIDCAKFGFATKVLEILARCLEGESSSHKKVDLFFLVDSITQSARGIKGDGSVYPSAIQALLPRLLLAAAPPGSSSHENHRQCLKVLKVWQERKIIPEPIIRHHIQELDALCGTYPNVGSRRTLRNERAFDDPIREMEGMLVDEYGSNSSIQFPDFCMPPMLKDEDGGSESDDESFEAVTPEHTVENVDVEKTLIEKRSHILEDVDGELEMEDVAPSSNVEMASTSNITAPGGAQPAHQQPDKHYAPLPRSLPPPPPPPPRPIAPPVFSPAECDSMPNGPESKHLPNSQNFNSRESMPKHSPFSRSKQAPLNSTHHRTHEYRDFEAQMPRHMPDNNNTCFNDRSHLSGRANGSHHADFNKGFHLRPPHPAPSNQFSYVQEQRSQSQRDMPPPPHHPNRFHARNTDNGNFYRDRDRNKFPPRDNIGECWRPPLPSISGPGYQDGGSGRMSHAPTSYGGPPREPPAPNSRWNYRPRDGNHRHFNPYRPPSEAPIPVANRGPAWRPR